MSGSESLILFQITGSKVSAAGSQQLETVQEPYQKADFALVVTDGGMVIWEAGTEDFEILEKKQPIFGESVRIRILPDLRKQYPYLYPDDTWTAYLLGSSLPDWYSAKIRDSIVKAFFQWRDTVYGRLDLKKLFQIQDPRKSEVPAICKTDIEDLLQWVSIYQFNIISPRSSIRETIMQRVGSSIGQDVWNYIKESLWTDIMEGAPIREILHGKSAGERQEAMLGALVGSFFTGITDWKYYTGESDGYPYQPAVDLFNRGYIISGGQKWRLHSVKDGSILYELPKEIIPESAAFAALVTAEQKVYYKAGVEYTSVLKKIFRPDTDEIAEVNIVPADDSGYGNPEGDWTIRVLTNPEPPWFGKESRERLWAAHKEWKAQVYSAFDYKGLRESLSVPGVHDCVQKAGPEATAYFKQWITIWKNAQEAGTPISPLLAEKGHKILGMTIWKEAQETVVNNYKRYHEGCPGPTACSLIFDKTGYRPSKAVEDFMGDSIADSMAAFIGSFITGFYDESGNYPYQPAAYLWNHGFIPVTNGSGWWLVSGSDRDMDVVCHLP